MNIKAKKSFSNPVLGNVTAGQTLDDVQDGLARFLIDNDMAERLDEPKKKPSTDGKVKPSPSLQAAPASPKRKQTTAKRKGGK
jgi:hypothetical protein